MRGYCARIGTIKAETLDWDQGEQNPFFLPDGSKVAALEEYIKVIRKDGNSIGARVNVVATGVPPGLGEPVFEILDSDLAAALMSINDVKGVELGTGFACVSAWPRWCRVRA